VTEHRDFQREGGGGSRTGASGNHCEIPPERPSAQVSIPEESEGQRGFRLKALQYEEKLKRWKEEGDPVRGC